MINNKKKLFIGIISLLVLIIFLSTPVLAQEDIGSLKVDASGLPIIGFGSLLTFVVRLIFILAGLAALIYGLWGGISWITSGGDKEAIDAARGKITSALLGIFVLVVVLTVVWTLEQIVFNEAICFGLSCEATIPGFKIRPIPYERCTRACNPGTETNKGSCVEDAEECADLEGTPAPDPANIDYPDTAEDERTCSRKSKKFCCCFDKDIFE